MSEARWSAVDQFISAQLLSSDPLLDAALAASQAGGLPNIQVAPNQGKLLSLLAQALGARKILELGTLGGYSTIWLARGLAAEGRLITLELEPKHAEVARANLARADLARKVEIRVGPALELLPQLEAERVGPFDLIFIDADKANYPAYFEWAVRLSRPGTLIVVDNVVRKGQIADATATDPNVIGARKLYELVAREPRVRATAIQTVGDKGYDGLLFALVTP
jgi:predicted O-methyltransferase YrrM